MFVAQWPAAAPPPPAQQAPPPALHAQPVPGVPVSLPPPPGQPSVRASAASPAADAAAPALIAAAGPGPPSTSHSGGHQTRFSSTGPPSTSAPVVPMTPQAIRPPPGAGHQRSLSADVTRYQRVPADWGAAFNPDPPEQPGAQDFGSGPASVGGIPPPALPEEGDDADDAPASIAAAAAAAAARVGLSQHVAQGAPITRSGSGPPSTSGPALVDVGPAPLQPPPSAAGRLHPLPLVSQRSAALVDIDEESADAALAASAAALQAPAAPAAASAAAERPAAPAAYAAPWPPQEHAEQPQQPPPLIDIQDGGGAALTSGPASVLFAGQPAAMQGAGVYHQQRAAAPPVQAPAPQQHPSAADVAALRAELVNERSMREAAEARPLARFFPEAASMPRGRMDASAPLRPACRVARHRPLQARCSALEAEIASLRLYIGQVQASEAAAVTALTSVQCVFPPHAAVCPGRMMFQPVEGRVSP